MTARTRDIERKLVEWFQARGANVAYAAIGEGVPSIHVAEHFDGDVIRGVDIDLTRLAIAIESGEIE